MKDSSSQSIREVVAQADHRRRARAADRALARLAPVCAVAVLGVAVVGRFAGWNRWLGVATLGLAVVALAALTLLQRRARATSDAIALSVDEDAGLRGELRSAHWFESADGAALRDDWSDFHVHQAAERAGRVDWPALYPSIKATRQWVLTAVSIAAIAGLAIRVPVRASSAILDATLGDPTLAAQLPPELRDKLAALMAQLEQGAMDKDAKKLSLDEMKDLMAKLDPALQKKLADLLEKAALGKEQLAKDKNAAKDTRADRAENSTKGLPEDVKWALEDMATRLAQQESDQRQTNPNNPSASAETAEKGMGSAQAEQKEGAMSEMAAPMVKEAASDPGGKMMMGGGGPMGGDSRPGAGGNQQNQQGGAEAILLAKALRKELLEASSDALGENVDKEDRRKKTEQGKSTLGYTRVAPPSAFEPSRASAPPPVPEARRSLLLNYFIRKK